MLCGTCNQREALPRLPDFPRGKPPASPMCSDCLKNWLEEHTREQRRASLTSAPDFDALRPELAAAEQGASPEERAHIAGILDQWSQLSGQALPAEFQVFAERHRRQSGPSV